MPNYALYEPASTPVTNLVTKILMSFNEGQEADLGPNKVKNPNLTGLDQTKPMRFNGTAIVQLTPAEMTSVETARKNEYVAAVKTAAKNIYLTPAGAQEHAIKLGFETIAELLVSELNVVRAALVPPLADRTNAQVKSAFKSTYESKVDAVTAP